MEKDAGLLGSRSNEARDDKVREVGSEWNDYGDESSRYENHLLLDSPCAKQEGEQVTQQKPQTTQERKKNQELVCLNIAAHIAPCHITK